MSVLHSDDAERRQTQQERVYRQLREQVLAGRFMPGRPVTLRGVAAELGVSLMPVREALRRLVAERALELPNNRRVAVPLMSATKLQEICAARVALETLAARHALPGIDSARLTRLQELDAGIDAAIAVREVERYITGNWAFHRCLYRAAPGNAAVLLPLIESLWLQSAPFMRLVLDRLENGFVTDHHRGVLGALRDGDARALTVAIEADIRSGVGSLTAAQLREVALEFAPETD
jgi:DNA-binding GntR family transcriptional regulator